MVQQKTLAPVKSAHKFTIDGKPGAHADAIPAQFNIEITVANGGGSAGIYRQCNSPQAKLLFVVVDPADVGKGGEWLWAPK